MSDKKKKPSWLQSIWQKKFALIAIALLIALLPMAVTKETVVLSKTLLTAIGIERDGTGFAVHGEALIFNFDPFGIQEREVWSATADTIEECLTIIGRNRGRTVSLSHCTIILLSEDMLTDTLTDDLRYLLDRTDLNNSCVLFPTDVPVDDLLHASRERGDARSALLQQIGTFNRMRDNHFVGTTLERFYMDMLGKNATSKIGLIGLQDGEIINDGSYKTLQ